MVQRQLARKERLAAELATERGRLQAMQREVRGLEIPGLAQGPVTVLRLRQEIQTLQGQCETMAQQVDRYCGPPVPLGETSEEFYQNIYTGQQAIIRPREPPPRPPPPRLPEGPPWTCHLCTFRNHPLLDKCEQCEMPRILLGTVTHTPLHKLDAASLLGNNNNNTTTAAGLSNKLDTVSSVAQINTSMANLNSVSSV